MNQTIQQLRSRSAIGGGFFTPSLTVVEPEVPFLPLESPASGGSVACIPSLASLALNWLAPTVIITAHKIVEPGTAGVILSTFAPTISASNNILVTPGQAALLVTAFAPTVSVGGNVVVPCDVMAVSLASLAPTIAISNHRVMTPGTGTVLISTFAPTITIGASVVVTPPTVGLTITTYAPTVLVTGQEQSSTPGYWTPPTYLIRRDVTFAIRLQGMITYRVVVSPSRAVPRDERDELKREVAAQIHADQQRRQVNAQAAVREAERIAARRREEMEEEELSYALALFLDED